MLNLRENERIDDLQINGLKIIQSKDGFCFGIDAVLLANFVKIRRNDKVCDLGTGTGIIPILIEAKSSPASIYALEIQSEVAEMAQRSVNMNNQQDIIKIVEGDIKNPWNVLKKSSMNVVVSNPPYMHPDGIKNPNDRKAISRHEIRCTLEDVMRTASELLMERGKFFMIHRPTRLADIISIGRRYRLEPKILRFVHSKISQAPTMVLCEFVKAGRPEMKILNPLIVYNEDSSYTDEIREIYSSNSIELA